MSDQNYPDDTTPEDSDHEEGYYSPEQPSTPATSLFTPEVNYYIRLAHNPTRFMVRSNITPGGGRFRARMTAYSAFPPIQFRMRLRHNSATNTYNIRNLNNPGSPHREIQTAPPIGIIIEFTETIPGGNFVIRPVGNQIYEIIDPLTERFIGTENENAEQRDLHFFSHYTPEQRQWYITTDPFSPLPPQKPIQEGIYTIHSTLQPSSVVESPLRTDDESEPFIKKLDGTFTQLWQFVYDRQLNAYQIISYTNQCLFAYDSGILGTPPRQRYRLRFTSRLNQTNASYFYVNPQEDGSFTLVSVKYPDQKFDLTLGITTNFNPVQLYQLNEYDAQNWLLKKVL